MQAFKAAQATGQGDMHSMLQGTFTSLDEGFLADTHHSSMVRPALYWQQNYRSFHRQHHNLCSPVGSRNISC